MMRLPETKAQTLYDIDRWQDILVSPSWVVFVGLLKEHREYLQKEANDYLRSHEDRKAGECIRAMDDCKKILDLISKRMKDLHDQSEKMNK